MNLVRMQKQMVPRLAAFTLIAYLAMITVVTLHHHDAIAYERTGFDLPRASSYADAHLSSGICPIMLYAGSLHGSLPLRTAYGQPVQVSGSLVPPVQLSLPTAIHTSAGVRGPPRIERIDRATHG